MVFAYFKLRRLQKVFANSAATMIRMQFNIAQTTPTDQVNDLWQLGYIYGASMAILDRMGVEPSPTAYKILGQAMTPCSPVDLAGAFSKRLWICVKTRISQRVKRSVVRSNTA